MKITKVVLGVLVASALVFAQRPSDPALLIPQVAPELDYVAVAEPFTFPAGTALAGAAASVARICFNQALRSVGPIRKRACDSLKLSHHRCWVCSSSPPRN